MSGQVRVEALVIERCTDVLNELKIKPAEKLELNQSQLFTLKQI